ncbi:MAG: hypothetical protein CSB13_00455, partial [Chloroflexi bacterium]
GWVSCSGQDNIDFEVTCAPQCGQSPGCPNTDAGVPSMSNIQPTPTRNMTDHPGNIPITWTENSTLTFHFGPETI